MKRGLQWAVGELTRPSVRCEQRVMKKICEERGVHVMACLILAIPCIGLVSDLLSGKLLLQRVHEARPVVLLGFKS